MPIWNSLDVEKYEFWAVIALNMLLRMKFFNSITKLWSNIQKRRKPYVDEIRELFVG